ncbi:MAG: hypothetical protein PHI63_06340 [Patescibacteria group bacterium]|nr:hypothetical protein [Patescibacteria group bacterium]
MAYDFIPILLLIGCVVALSVIVGRKLPQLKTLDVASIPAEQELQLKQKILANRLHRRLEIFRRFLQALLRPLLLGVIGFFKRTYQHVLDLESRYRKDRRATLPEGNPSLALEELYAEAQRARANGQGTAAEEKLIQLIGLDPRHVPAYEMLGELYLESREYAKAREVYAYLCKIYRRQKSTDASAVYRLAAAYLNISRSYLELRRKAQALQYARKAAELEPNNPRTLDFLLKISIVVEDKALASKTWGALQQADPDNAKLAELQQQIDKLP